ncbi:hypothetical protein [Cohnella hongkongensis]|uniref:Uncharacterized protein n=1 Tax=Cohnella hongkongensis TaxID=178337 RepID=A0ABV9FGS7_9BACL
MNKKLAMIGAGVVAGSVLLMSSVYAGVGSAPGYEAYKTAIKNTASIDNVTHTVKVSVEDNGKPVIQAASTVKTAGDGSSGNVEIRLPNGETQNLQFYRQDDRQILKSGESDVYRILETDNEFRNRFKKHEDEAKFHDPGFSREVEKVIDTLVGNLKNDVTLSKDGDMKEIALKLEGGRIPALANAIGSLLIRESGRDHGASPRANADNPLGIDLSSLKDGLPKLTEEIKIEAVILTADVDADDLLAEQTAEIRISGKDADGVKHDAVVKLEVGLSDINATTPDTVDLTGKQTVTVDVAREAGPKHWR